MFFSVLFSLCYFFQPAEVNVHYHSSNKKKVSNSNSDSCSLNLAWDSSWSGGRRVKNPHWMTHIHPFSFNTLLVWQGYKTTLWQNTFPPLGTSPTIWCKPHSPYHYLSFLFFPLLGHFTGPSICSFHLPRLSPGPLIYTAPTAPLGQTGLRRHSLRALKGHCVHTDMKRRTETENGF